MDQDFIPEDVVSEPLSIPAWQTIRDMKINVSEAERWASAALGGGLVVYGLRKGGFKGALFAIAGGSLLARGWMGKSFFYRALGINSATGEGLPGQDKAAHLIRVDKSISISRPAEDIFRHLRELENLPSLFRHLKTVSPMDGVRSRWTARMPAGSDLSWDSEITEERSNRMLAWRSAEEAGIRSEGSIVLDPLAGGRTQMGVHLEYSLPPGRIGRVFAKLFGRHPDRLIDEEMHRFKSKMEEGA